MTYSIVARDPDTGWMGVGVQTCNLAVGTWVPWAQAGVGVVATQASAERRYGTRGLEMMAKGLSPAETLSTLLAADERRAFRQVAMLDRRGQIASHTGERVFPRSGSLIGEGFAVQANMMARDGVVETMAEAYGAVRGDLAARILAALDGAERAGGDIRGRQTAALLIVEDRSDGFPLFDLRVDHHPQPITELRRLVSLQRAYNAEYTLAAKLERGDRDEVEALFDQIQDHGASEPYIHFLSALHRAEGLDDRSSAIESLSGLISNDPMWAEYLRREAVVAHFSAPGIAAGLYDALGLPPNPREDQDDELD